MGKTQWQRWSTLKGIHAMRRDVSKLVICGQGPPPPNPQVVERFQQVISQLFQQVCRHRYDALLTMHVLEMLCLP